MRIGDRERRLVDERLRAAHADGVLTLGEYDERAAACFAARTQAELDVLTRDLPRPPAVVAPEPPQPVVVDRAPVRRRSRRGPFGGLIGVAVIALGVFAGTQVVGAKDGVAMFGSEVVQVGSDAAVDVGTLFGTIRVEVPADVHVVTSGVVIFGSKRCELACAQPGTRTVTVKGNGAFGSILIERQGETLSGRGRNDD